MPNIRLLPPTLINRIAAGEVIERPSSALKEIAENAIDAGATNLDIILEGDGRNYMSVTDNGAGMTAEEMTIAVERHATSKLPADDLLDIRWFGFRGEALPAIGAVARLTITSRKKNAESAYKLRLEGGKKFEPEPANIRSGTKVEIADLFFATPARLKFLKSERTERDHAINLIKRLAMAHPTIGITLTTDGRKILNYPAENGDLLDARLNRLAAVMGKDFAINSLPIDAERGEAKITGYVGLPTYHRGNSEEQYMFVNNRPVKDKQLLGAIRGAYMDVLARDKYPVLALFLDIPPQYVDVNVHPAKSEVRFREADIVRGLVAGSIRRAIAESGFRASSTLGDEALKAFVSTAPAQTSYSFSARPPSYNSGNVAVMERSMSYLAPAEIAPQSFSNSWQPAARSQVEEPQTSLQEFPLGAAKAQIGLTYIVAETTEGMILIDQHAAHERIVYEKMKSEIEASGINRQKLLLPLNVELKIAAEYLLKHAESLAQLGLLLHPAKNENSVMVTEIPSILADYDISALISDLADDLIEHGETLSLNEALEHVTETAACHNSVRAGRKLNIDEMNALLRKMEQTPNCGQCNHGRPTYIKLGFSQIESLFGRS